MIKIMTGSAAALALGLYLKRGVTPVIVAYRVGRDVERLAADPARLATALKLGYKFGRGDRAKAGSS